MAAESWKLTLACTRAEAEAIAESSVDEDLAAVLVTSEPDPARPDAWQLDAYFEAKPTRAALNAVARLVPSSRVPARAQRIVDQDWLALSQAGLAPIRAGRFHVRTPDHAPDPAAIDLVIPAGLAFGTGHHATTLGCLIALDRLKRGGKRFHDIIDVGTGTGLLAFAARRLWPAADITASDVDPVAIGVVRENAAANGVSRLRLIVADGVRTRAIARGAPYDLVIANILAQPLIEMAGPIAGSIGPGGTLMLAGLLDTQVSAVLRAYRRYGTRAVNRGSGEWPVLLLRKRRG